MNETMVPWKPLERVCFDGTYLVRGSSLEWYASEIDFILLIITQNKPTKAP